MTASAPSRGERKTARPVRTRASASRASRHPAVHACRARRQRPSAAAPAPTSTAQQHAERRQRVPDQRLLAAGEQPDRREHDAPRITSASTFSSVCETSVPSTAGRRSRGRPSRRATISARDGSPSRAGSVADISTPIVVPCMASMRRGSASGSAARRIACQATARAQHRQAHQRERDEHPHRLGVHAARARSGASPIRSNASSVPTPAPTAAAATTPPRRAILNARLPLDGSGSSDGQAAGGRARLAGRPAARRSGRRRAPAASTGAGTRARVLVGLDDLLGHPRPGVALGRCGRRRRRAPRCAGGRSRGRAASRRGAWRRRGGTSRPSTPSETTSR